MIRETVSIEAVLQVPKIRPHRNPVQGSNSMWLLCAGARYQGLPVKVRPGHDKEMRTLPRRTRGVEPPVPSKEGRNGQDESWVRHPTPLPPRTRTTRRKYPNKRHARSPPKDKDKPSYSEPGKPERQDPLPIEERTEKDQHGKCGQLKR
jgi:hypothetical protein